MPTAANKTAEHSIRAWCKAHNIEVQGIRHIHPRAYVIGHAAPLCLVVSTPWIDSEPHLQETDKANPLKTVHTFDKTLKTGDWCSTAYVTSVRGGETIAVALDFTPEKTTEPKKQAPGRAAGGKARAEALSPERRKEISRKAVNARWQKS